MTLELPGQEPIPVAIDPPRRSPAAELGLARTVIEATVWVGLFLVLVAWCFWIARPFLVAVLWVSSSPSPSIPASAGCAI